jgi:hypothetical protein
MMQVWYLPKAMAKDSIVETPGGGRDRVRRGQCPESNSLWETGHYIYIYIYI